MDHGLPANLNQKQEADYTHVNKTPWDKNSLISLLTTMLLEKHMIF